MKFWLTRLLLFAVALTTQLAVSAQCAMCKASAESATETTGDGLASGLNTGILYLMGVPYVLLMTGVLVFYRKKIVSFFRG